MLISLASLSAMIIILTIYSDELILSEKAMRENLLQRRKTSLYKISLSGEENQELLRDLNKGFFQKRKERIESLIFKADVKITYHEFVFISAVFGLIGWVIGNFLNNLFISLILSITLYRFPKSYFKFICSSLTKEINEQLEPTLSQIIGLLPAKKTLINAIEACINNMNEPLKKYFTEFVNNINNANRSFEEALDELARKIDSKPFNDFARIAVVHYKHGGDTIFAFNSIPETMRDIKMIQSAQEAELDSLKLLGYIFTALTPLSFLFYYFTDKSNIDILINTGVGKVITAIVLINLLITVKLVVKISEPVKL